MRLGEDAGMDEPGFLLRTGAIQVLFRYHFLCALYTFFFFFFFKFKLATAQELKESIS